RLVPGGLAAGRRSRAEYVAPRYSVKGRIAMAAKRKPRTKGLGTREYRRLAAFRFALRAFLRFSEQAARRSGLTTQHYQALLALRAAPGRQLTVKALAAELFIRHNSAVGLADRLARQALVRRERASVDRRVVFLALAPRGERLLERLA